MQDWKISMPTPTLICPNVIKSATVSNLALCAVALALPACTFGSGPDGLMVTQENYLLSSRVVEPVPNGISTTPLGNQPVLVRIDDTATVREVMPIAKQRQTWTVYAKPYPKPTVIEAVAGAGINNGIVATVYFGKNSRAIGDSASLEVLAEKLKNVAGRLTVVGYTDPAEHRTRPSLGKSRADEVAKQLESLGVAKTRIKTVNGGASKLYYAANKVRCVNIVLKVE